MKTLNDMTPEEIRVALDRIQNSKYTSAELHSRVGAFGEPQRTSVVDIMDGEEAVRLHSMNGDTPLDRLDKVLQSGSGHETLDRDVVLASYAQAAVELLKIAITISAATLATEAKKKGVSEAEARAHVAEVLTGHDDDELFMGSIAMFSGLMFIQKELDALRLVPVAKAIERIRGVELVEVDEQGAKRELVDMSSSDALDRLRDTGFDFTQAAMLTVIEQEPETPVLVHWGVSKIDEMSWSGGGMAGEFRPHCLTVMVAHRIHGYLLLSLTVGVDAEQQPTITLNGAVAETVEEHNDPKRMVMSADPFGARTTPGQHSYQISEAGKLDAPEAASMLRALANVLEGKSNRIEWDERFDEDEQEPTIMGRKAQA